MNQYLKKRHKKKIKKQKKKYRLFLKKNGKGLPQKN